MKFSADGQSILIDTDASLIITLHAFEGDVKQVRCVLPWSFPLLGAWTFVRRSNTWTRATNFYVVWLLALINVTYLQPLFPGGQEHFDDHTGHP